MIRRTKAEREAIYLPTEARLQELLFSKPHGDTFPRTVEVDRLHRVYQLATELRDATPNTGNHERLTLNTILAELRIFARANQLDPLEDDR